MTLPWTVSATYLRGTLAAENRKVFSAPGSGRFITPPAQRVLAGVG